MTLVVLTYTFAASLLSFSLQSADVEHRPSEQPNATRQLRIGRDAAALLAALTPCPPRPGCPAPDTVARSDTGV